MPYIKEDRRDECRPGNYAYVGPQDAGELNFAITSLCISYIELKGLRYQQINDIMGALEGAKLEFYRRLASNYEDEKAKINGDCYPVSP